MRTAPFATGALSLAVLAVLTAVGTGAGAPRDDAGAALSVHGSVSASGLPPPSERYSVTLTYTPSNDSDVPVLDVTWDGELYQSADTTVDATAPTGSVPTPFDCTSQDADFDTQFGARFDAHGLLWLSPGASVTCAATLDLAPGSYTAWLTVYGYALPGTLSPSPTDEACSGLIGCFWPLTPVSARSCVPFTLLVPPSVSPSTRPASPSPSPSRSAVVTSPAAPAPRTSAASQPSKPPAPSARPSATPRPSPRPSAPPVLAALNWQAPPLVDTEVPTALFVLIMIVPAVAAGAALLGRRR